MELFDWGLDVGQRNIGLEWPPIFWLRVGVLRVLQVLPELNSGGVERGVVEFARFLVEQGHDSAVISAGGRLVDTLQAEGSEHYLFPVHKKSLLSLAKVRPLRRLIKQINPDIIHVRSRMPAWLVWLSVARQPATERPGLVSTFHGLYSVNAYSAIMGCGDRVIAISNCVRDYIVNNYPKIDPATITVIHRGVDRQTFPENQPLDEVWRTDFFQEHPHLHGKPIILMPGRLSRWKGQIQFIELMAELKKRGHPAQGLIVGGPTPGKEDYEIELKTLAKAQGVDDRIRFLGHRSDMANLYKVSDVVCNLSQKPEPFGRTVIEALALGTPVVAYNEGGPAESLAACLPQGLVAVGDVQLLADKVIAILEQKPSVHLPDEFTLDQQARTTLAVYESVLASRSTRS